MINIPLGFCLKLPPADKTQKKKSQLLSKVLIFFLVKRNRPMQSNPPHHHHTQAHTHTKEDKSKQLKLENQFLICADSTWQLDEQLALKKPREVTFLSGFFFPLLRSRLRAHTSTYPSPRYSKSSRLSDRPQVAGEVVMRHKTSRPEGWMVSKCTKSHLLPWKQSSDAAEQFSI